MNWEMVLLGEVLKTSAGGTPLKSKKDYYEGGEIPWLMSGEVCTKDIYSSANKITKLGVENSSAKVFPADTTLVAMYGATAGQVGILRFPCATNQAVCGILPSKNYLAEFLYYYLTYYKKTLLLEVSGVAQPNLSQIKIKNVPIPKLSLPIQQKIVAKLDAIFAEIDIAIAAAEANANNAEALFQSYITQIFEDKKYEFKLVKFGSTANFVRGPFGGSLKKSIFVEKGYAVYEQQHAIDNQFTDIRYYIDNDKFEEMKRFELRSGDLIMSCSGTMGKIAIVPENIQQGVINQALLKITPNTNVYGNYIARLLSSKFFQDTLSKLSGGAAIQNVPAVSILKDILIPLPNSNNQKLIIDVIGMLESNKNIIKNSYARKSTELKALKKSILQKAFSGELVKD